MEELDPFCDQFQQINLNDTFYDNLHLLCKYVDDETIGEGNATAVALQKFQTAPDYNENLYKMWLHLTISKWHKIIQDSNKFTTAEESCAIYLMRAITEISRTAICYDGCNILTELTNIIKKSFAEYSVTGWRFLCSELTFETLMRSCNSYSATSSNYVSEYEAEDLVEACDENIDNADEQRDYLEKCKVLTDIATEFLSCKFTLTNVKLAAQKFVDRTLTLNSDLVFNVPKTYHAFVDTSKHLRKHKNRVDKKKSKDKKLLVDDGDDEESTATEEINLRDLYEIFPAKMSLEANSDEFWEALQSKYTEQKDVKLGQVESEEKKSKKGKKEKKVEI